MSIEILIDMNLSPDWVDELSNHGWASVHWSAIGNPRATDREIMHWARSNSYVVFTHDLDFGTMLALTHASGPSVIQVRGKNVLPDHLGPTVVATLTQHKADLAAGALVVVDQSKSRVRVLPLLIHTQATSANKTIHPSGNSVAGSLRSSTLSPRWVISNVRPTRIHPGPDERRSCLADSVEPAFELTRPRPLLTSCHSRAAQLRRWVRRLCSGTQAIIGRQTSPPPQRGRCLQFVFAVLYASSRFGIREGPLVSTTCQLTTLAAPLAPVPF